MRFGLHINARPEETPEGPSMRGFAETVRAPCSARGGACGEERAVGGGVLGDCPAGAKALSVRGRVPQLCQDLVCVLAGDGSETPGPPLEA